MEEQRLSQAPVRESTLETFRSAAASGAPLPAGVAIAAVSAGFALGLLAKVLTVTVRRKDFGGDAGIALRLAESARTESTRMLQYADEDVAAFNAYMTSARLPRSTDREREERQTAINAAIRKAIETPMAAARSAAVGINLCSDSAGMVHKVVAADLGSAVSLLAGALRVFLLCADSNLQQLASDPAPYSSLMDGRAEMEIEAFRQVDFVLKQAAETLGAPAARRDSRG